MAANNARDLAIAIFKSLTKEEVDVLVKVLTHYNSKCGEEHRAACVQSGCKSVDGPPDLSKADLTEGFEKRAQDVYMSGQSQVCTYCGK